MRTRNGKRRSETGTKPRGLFAREEGAYLPPYWAIARATLPSRRPSNDLSPTTAHLCPRRGIPLFETGKLRMEGRRASFVRLSVSAVGFVRGGSAGTGVSLKGREVDGVTYTFRDGGLGASPSASPCPHLPDN